MKVRVDPTKCQGYGVCIELAPHNFVRDDWGLVQAAKDDIESDDLPAVVSAVSQCPISAIRWLGDENGANGAERIQSDQKHL